MTSLSQTFRIRSPIEPCVRRACCLLLVRVDLELEDRSRDRGQVLQAEV